MGASVRYRANRGAWYVFFQRGAKRWNRSFGDGPEAEAQAREVAAAWNAEQDERREREFLLGGGPAPFEIVAEAWWDARSMGMPNSSQNAKRPVVFSRLIPCFGREDVRTLDDDRIRAAAVAFVGQDYKRETIETTGSVLDSILSWCVKKNYASQCPALRIFGGRGPRAIFREVAAARCAPTEPVQAWSRDEVLRLLLVAKDRGPWLSDPIMFAAQTGCRRGEIIALDWMDVDIERARATIRQSTTRGQTKTTKADKRRTIELAADTVHMLRERAARGRNGRVFRDPAGEPWTDYGFSGFWIRCRKKAPGVRQFKFHCFRHTWSTWALAAGHDPAWCAGQIGDTLEVFLRRYAHAMPRERRSMDFLSLTQDDVEPRPVSAVRVATPRHARGSRERR